MVLSLERWITAKAIAVVTGANSGIGAATAELLVKNGLTVVGLDRQIEALEELSKNLSDEKGKLIPYKADISKENEVIEAFEWIKNNVGPVHILHNNAAVFNNTSSIGNIIDGSYEAWKEIFDTNILGMSVVTREAVKQMRANNINGHIIHMCSIVGHQVPNFPYIAFYSASKFAIRALTEALRNELREAKTKIKITSITPGFVQTGILKTDPKLVERFARFPKLQGTDIADAILYVLSTPEHVQVHELTIRPQGEFI